ncbi:MAG: endonuclease/exonuclease/phosphatase family protein [Marmoricola sp.]
MKTPSRRWLEPALVAGISLALVAAFWAAWQRTTGPHADDGRVVDARGLAIPQQAATEGPATPTPTPTATATATASASPSAGIRKAHRAYISSNRSLAARVQSQLAAATSHTDVVLATYNVLGASHTTAHGSHAGRAPGPVRARWAVTSLLAHHVDVVALQEFQRSQAEAFEAASAGTYDVWPGTQRSPAEGENSVAWRSDRFDLVQAQQNSYPYFDGHRRPYPMVLLRDRASGVEFWVTSNHNPAFDRNTGWRHQAVAEEIADADRLLGTAGHAPLVLAGDMNDREAFLCPVVDQTPLHPAGGGTSGCVPPRPTFVDWILGSGGVQFTSYAWDGGDLVRRTSDHPLVYASARIWGADTVPAVPIP